MTSIARKIKNYLYSASAPEFLFASYFNRMLAKNRKELNRKLSEGQGLMEHFPTEQKKYWEERINDVLQGPDNANIPRVANAGQLTGDSLVMHNGIQIDPLSYYSFPLLKMLIDNKGVHEPQEEKIFQEVLKSMQAKEKMTMLELGSYWSFYSMWFMKTFPSADCYMVEPDRKNLFYGKENLKRNQQKGTFIHAGIGGKTDTKNNITTVDDICKKHQLQFLDILHADIQGFELEMLHGAAQLLSANGVGYVFISTHSNELHQDCHQLLKDKYGFTMVANADLDETYSWDGILVMKNPKYPGVEEVLIAKKIKV